MMYLLTFAIVILSVETVMCEKGRIGYLLHDKQITVNGSSGMTMTTPAMSVSHCGMLCLTDGDCMAANYEDVGICHMSTSGHISMENSSDTTAILAPLKDSLNMVGWWPLQEAFGGDDLSGHANHIDLYDVSFPDDDVTPWARPAAAFNATARSYGLIQNGQHLDVKSFSWMTKIYPQSNIVVSCLLEWRYNGQTGVEIWLEVGNLETIITIPGCSYHSAYHPASFSINAWHTMAVTYDFPTNTLTLWQDGESHVSTKPACGSTIETSPELYIGYRPQSYVPFNGRLSCMSLYSSVVDYDVMYAATMHHCGGDGLH